MKSNRHAYCIIAHNDPYCLQALIDLIDDERNDIYILFDKKSDKEMFGDLTAKSSLIFTEEEIDISWGDISLVKAELILFEAVLKAKVSYGYIHLLSGSDLPLHGQDYIHKYFESLPEGTNLIGFLPVGVDDKLLRNKTLFRHVLTKYQKDKNAIRKGLSKVVRHTWLLIQKAFGVKVDWSGYTLAKGAQWVSITPEFANYLIDNREEITRRFKYVLCPDEIYKQTFAMSSRFKDTVLTMEDEYKGCMREIDWTRGNPYVWRMDDFDVLMRSDALFARKFQSSVDKEVIDRIRKEVKGPLYVGD